MRKYEEKYYEESCWNKARPDEMLFILLGRDSAAPVAIRSWCKARVEQGKNHITDMQIIEALAVAETMEKEAKP